ncbi:MAG: hypothetical protein ACRCT8_09630 [Lacipirellulaceae bacterium]
MAAKKQIDLADRLSQMTRTGKLKWQQTSEEDVFMVAFAQFSVLLSCGPSRDGFIETIVEVRDEAGAPIDRFIGSEVGRYSELGDTLDMARRQASGADSAIDQILKEMDQIDPRPEPPSAFPSDDEIPF